MRRWFFVVVACALGGCAGKESRAAEHLAKAPSANHDIVAIQAARDHACALDKAGAVWCWGNNHDLQVTDPASCAESCLTPTSAGLTEPASAIGLGERTSCALLSSGAVRCWGEHQRPLQRAAARADRLAIEDPLSCDISAGVLSCAGWNRMGRLGVRDDQHEYVARAAVPVPRPVKSVIIMLQFGCAATDELYCWGSRLECAGPRPVKTPQPIVDIQGGGSFACFLGSAGDVFGLVQYQEHVAADGGVEGCSPAIEVEDELKVPLAKGAKAVDCFGPSDGERCETCQGCIIRADDSVACWGRDDKAAPQASAGLEPVPGLTGVAQITMGNGFACALTRQGKALCWGRNERGQLGRGFASPRESVPAEPVLLSR
jgi:alpha-tubulin suppressor-like RCC1 family protein